MSAGLSLGEEGRSACKLPRLAWASQGTSAIGHGSLKPTLAAEAGCVRLTAHRLLRCRRTRERPCMQRNHNQPAFLTNCCAATTRRMLRGPEQLGAVLRTVVAALG